MSVKQQIKMPDFEADQQDAMKKTDNIQSLADQVEQLEKFIKSIEDRENEIKELKKSRDRISGDIIPTMMSEMGLSELKLQDGSHLKVATSYKAHISEANKEMAFNWLRDNGLGDIVKNEITVNFGQSEDNKAIAYANLAREHGYEPSQKETVHHASLSVVMREWKEKGNEIPSDLFSVLDADKAKITGKS